MPMVGQNQQQLNDKDLMTSVLTELKHMADALNTSILEASSEELRRDYLNILTDVYNAQKQVFDAMAQRGWYQPKPAQPQDIQQAKNKFTGMGQQR